MAVDLNFASKGTLAVLNDQEKIKLGAKQIGELYKLQNAELKRTGQDASRAINSTLTQAERVQKKIDALKKAIDQGIGNPEKNQQALARLQGQLGELDKKSKPLAGQFAKAFGSAGLGLVAQYVAPTAAIATAFGVITSEVRDQLRLIDEAASAKLTVSQSRNAVIRNLPGADQATREAVLRENQQLATRLGVSEVEINKARAQALSSSGGDRQASLEAVEGAARFLFDRPTEIGGFAGSLLDLSKVTGTSDSEVNLGLLSTVAGLSRVAEPGRQAANIPAALIGATGFGLTTAEAGALFSTLTEFSGDLTGESGRTATIQVAEALRNFREENLTKKQSNLLDDAALGRLRAIEGLSTGDKLQALQEDEELSKAFLKGFAGEKRFKSQVEKLVTDAGSDVARSFATNTGKIGDNTALAVSGRESIASLDANRLNRQARFESGLAATDQQLAVRDPNENITAEARQSLQNILQRAGRQSKLGATGRQLLARLQDDSIGLSVNEAVGLIAPVIEDLEDGVPETTRSVSTGMMGVPYTYRIPGREATPEEHETAKALRELVSLTGAQLEESKKQTAQNNKPAIPTR